MILGAAYLLWLYQRVMFGSVTNEKNEKLLDLNWREYATLVPLVVLAFWIGIYPKPLFRVLDAPVQRIVQVVNPQALAASAQPRKGLDADVTQASAKTTPSAPARTEGK